MHKNSRIQEADEVEEEGGALRAHSLNSCIPEFLGLLSDQRLNRL
jgi:hypothetical protein